MREKKNIIRILIIGVILCVDLSVLIKHVYPQTQKIATTTKPNLKKYCIDATIRGIKLDIEKLDKWLKIPEKELTEGAKPREKIKTRLKQLKKDLKKYKNIQIEDYKLPEKKEIIGWVYQPCVENTILQIEGMTRSGPFYHIVGIKGGNYAVIKPHVKYRMTIYLLYPRDYPFPSYYIYIGEYKQIK